MSYSFIERELEYLGWKCHDLLRGVQSDYLGLEQPQVFADFHRSAAHYFESHNNKLEFLYHCFFYQTDQAFVSWMSSVQEQHSLFNLNESERLFDLIESVGVEVRLSVLQRAAYMHIRGLQYLYSSDTSQAENFFKESLRFYEGANQNLGIANLLDSLGDLERSRNNHEVARKYYGQAREVYSSIGDSSGAGNIYWALGILELSAGNLNEAKKDFALALELIDKTRHPNNYANALSGLGDANFLLENFEVAENLYEDAQKIFDGTRNRRGQATAFRRLGEVKDKRGDRNAAKQAVKAAIKLLEGSSASGELAYAYVVLGDVNAGDLTGGPEDWSKYQHDAVEYYFKALEIYQNSGNKRGEGIVSFSLGSLLMQKGQFEEAKKHLLLSHMSDDASSSPIDNVNFLMRMVQVECHLNNVEQAKAYYISAMEIVDKMGLRYTPTTRQWRIDFWTMVFHLQTERYILMMRIIDWLSKPTEKDSEKYIKELEGTLLTSDAEQVLSEMLDFGSEKELLHFHFSLLRDCRTLGIERAYSKHNHIFWNKT